LAALNGAVYIIFVLFVGPLIVVMNLFVMFIMTRKEVRSTYTFVFFLMALNQTVVIGSLSFSMFKTLLFAGCNPWFYSLTWALFDLIVMSQLVSLCKAHATWLAVILALMRLMSVRSHGTSELQLKLVLLLCGGALLFVFITNIPNFLSYTIYWVRFDSLCDNTDYGEMMVPITFDSIELYKNDCLILRLSSLLTGVFHSALPCVLLIVLSVVLIRFLRKVSYINHQTFLEFTIISQADRTTTLLILVMITTMISEIPQAILGLLEGFLSDQMREQVTTKIS
ncbi:hypothetical protein PMAYCL1PPCAC_16358, partial [Pristionchus mayeri]